MKSENIRYLPQVDHLRAVAAVWFVLYHAFHLVGSRLVRGADFDATHWTYTDNPLFALLLEGHTAVALFMVLSGFIFTYGALGRPVAYGPFLWNRFVRIYPLYLLVMMLELSAASARGKPTEVVTVLPVSDFRWSCPTDLVPMSWAVAVEFQFYVLFPVLLARFSARPFAAAAAASLAGGRGDGLGRRRPRHRRHPARLAGVGVPGGPSRPSARRASPSTCCTSGSSGRASRTPTAYRGRPATG